MSSDQNSRGCLAFTIDQPKTGPIQIFVTHLSFDAGEQCRQFIQLLKFVEEHWKRRQSRHQILMGDMNIYFDFEW